MDVLAACSTCPSSASAAPRDTGHPRERGGTVRRLLLRSAHLRDSGGAPQRSVLVLLPDRSTPFRRERVSTMLMLGTTLLTVRTVVSFVTASAFLYFIQPTMSAFLASFLLVLGAVAGRPFTQRFTHDFCPLTPELLSRPSVHRFFVRVPLGGDHVLERSDRPGPTADVVDSVLPARTTWGDTLSHGKFHCTLDCLVRPEHAARWGHCELRRPPARGGRVGQSTPTGSSGAERE